MRTHSLVRRHRKASANFGLIGKPESAPALKRSQNVPLTELEAGQFVCADCRTRSGKRQAKALFALYARMGITVKPERQQPAN